MSHLFGTDGIRGRASRYPMDAETVMKVGRAAALEMGRNAGSAAKAVIGQDTRISGDMIAQAVAAGILSAGMPVLKAGVVPTPAVARLVIDHRAAMGIMISASHNPFEDNGIKIFDHAGLKIDDRTEAAIEDRIRGAGSPGTGPEIEPAALMPTPGDGMEDYRRFLVSAGQGFGRLDGLALVLDCANGATSRIAPLVFGDLGASVTVIADRPDGRNINAGCGSEHPELLARQVVAARADAGLAFDGDGDRIAAVDERGRVLKGDQIIAILGRDMDSKKKLTPRCVVTTVMSNLGLGQALQRMGIVHQISDVGDRRVMQVMHRTGAILGGEDSGHIIFGDLHTTGDGILSGLRLAAVLASAGQPLSELSRVMTVYPQALLAVPVKNKPPLAELDAVVREISAVEGELKGQGRVLVRYSGTQPVCRVMVEGPTTACTETLCRRIAQVVQNSIG